MGGSAHFRRRCADPSLVAALAPNRARTNHGSNVNACAIARMQQCPLMRVEIENPPALPELQTRKPSLWLRAATALLNTRD